MHRPLKYGIEEPSVPSLTFALEPIGSSGDMTDKLGFLLTITREYQGKGQACTHCQERISGVKDYGSRSTQQLTCLDRASTQFQYNS